MSFWLGLLVAMVCACISISNFYGPLSLSQTRIVSVEIDAGHGFHDPSRLNKETNSYPEVSKAIQPIQFRDDHAHHDVDFKAKELEKKVRVLCYITSTSRYFDKKDSYIRSTWGRRCNKLVFETSVTNTSFASFLREAKKRTRRLAGKFMNALSTIYENHLNDADWFMVADDDTYVIVENLRYFLSSQNKNDPVYFGHYAAYVLSKAALRRFGDISKVPEMPNEDVCQNDFHFDVCMKNMGIKNGNSTDKLGRRRFYCYDPERPIMGHLSMAQKGQEMFSDYAISFHKVSAERMSVLEFYTYHLRPFGIRHGIQQLNHDGS